MEYWAGLFALASFGAVTGPDPVPLRYQAPAETKGEEYYKGFVHGYETKTKAKKRGARLTGGLLGTAAFVLLLLNANSD